VRTLRVLWFIVAIVFGLLVGLLAGWVLFPPEINVSQPDSLRADYQADYVLMTAEIFAQDKNIHAAADRLKLLNPDNPIHAVQEAILTAQQLQYSSPDMQLLADLFTSMETWTPQVESTPS